MKDRYTFEQIIDDRELVRFFYARYTTGIRTPLTTTCFQYVEQKCADGEAWAINLRNEVYKR